MCVNISEELITSLVLEVYRICGLYNFDLDRILYFNIVPKPSLNF